MLDKANPLWLPAGSVRSILAMGIVATTMALFINGTAPDGLVAIAGAIVGYYFNKSGSDKPENAPEPTTTTITK